jgi:hypothetical protein
MLTRTSFKTTSLSLMKVALVVAVLACVATTARAQAVAPANVSGRVLDGEHGIAGITVTLMSADPSMRFRAVTRARTDGEGRYRLTNIAPGRYQLMPSAPVYVLQDTTTPWPPGKSLNLVAGEEVTDMDFRVERGGVITGRITDADGNPVISEMVMIEPVDKNKPSPRQSFIDSRDYATDDRGIYRIYGLPPGHYRVSVGQSAENGAISYGRRRLYRRTFYPDATDEAQARIVEITAGSEATDIDITLGRALKTYKASGRFVYAETGEGAPNVQVGYGVYTSEGRGLSSYGGSALVSNARGEFQIDGLAPGHYAAFSFSREETEFYSDPATFEIKDTDVQGLVVKLRRGASVSGGVQIEGLSDRATAARMLSGLRFYSFMERSGPRVAPEYGRQVTVGADGLFRVGGLRAGKLRFGLADERTGKLTVSRIELNGASMGVGNGIDVADGAQITGVRIVLAYGSGIVRGQVNYTNGTLPAGARVIAFAQRPSSGMGDGGGIRSVEVDARGRFQIEGLAPGDYDIRVRVFSSTGVYGSEAQRISLSENGDINVTSNVDLSAPSRGGRP